MERTMPRRLAPLTVLLAALIAALASATAASAAPSALAVPSPLTGKITYLGPASVTIQTGGREVGVVNALTRGATAVSKQALPYVWGGGHAEAGVASVGVKGGPGYNGRRRGYDCSGAVAAVLSAAGLWPAGSPVPNDAGVIAELRSEKLIARGAGTAPNAVTLYDDPGVHIFMAINGRFFGTSDGGSGDPSGGPEWLDDGAPDAWSHAYKQWHFLPGVLADRTTYGQSYTFTTSLTPTALQGAALGDTVTIGYRQDRSGAMDLATIAYPGAVPVSGTVTAIAPDDSTVTLTTSTGQPLTLTTAAVPALIAGLAVGDGVTLSYTTETGGVLVPRTLSITSVPAPVASPVYPTPVAPAPVGAAAP
jgi:hypothetical protein